MGRIDLSEYDNLSARLGCRSLEDGRLMFGTDHLDIADGEPVMHDGEEEVARIAGTLFIQGLYSGFEKTPDGEGLQVNEDYRVGEFMRAATSMVLTTQRWIVMAIGGTTKFGAVEHNDEIHTFTWPWDLIDEIRLPLKKTLLDRFAGGRNIVLTCQLTDTRFELHPEFKPDGHGGNAKLSADEAFRLLTRTAATHRLGVAPPAHREELQGIADGSFARDDKQLVARLTPPYEGVPAHLEGRVVGSGEAAVWACRAVDAVLDV